MRTSRRITKRVARRLHRRGLRLALLAVGIVILKAENCSKEDFYTPLTSSGNGGGDFTVSLGSPAPGWDHTMPGVESVECKVISTSPAQAGATWTATITGPTEGGASGVISGQSFAGTLNANGRAELRVRINRLGTYMNSVSVTSAFITRTATANVTVTGDPNECPAAGS